MATASFTIECRDGIVRVFSSEYLCRECLHPLKKHRIIAGWDYPSLILYLSQYKDEFKHYYYEQVNCDVCDCETSLLSTGFSSEIEALMLQLLAIFNKLEEIEKKMQPFLEMKQLIEGD